MRLPDALYAALRMHMGDHGHWHAARHREAWLPMAARPAWRTAREAHPTLKYLDEPGAGAEFLTFHRDMVRHFKWLCDPVNTPGNTHTFEAWKQLPGWLVARFPPGILAATTARLLYLVRYGTLDQLGSFIERTDRDYSPGSNFHNLAHGLIARHEATVYPNDPRLENAGMTDFSTCHYNEHFWSLHGWIDEIYAMWQYAHGEAVDQSPTPHHHGGGGGHGPIPTPPPPPTPPAPPGGGHGPHH